MRTEAFIDGRFVPAADGRTFATLSPRDGSEIAPVARGDAQDIDRAVAAARRGFERGDWSARRSRTPGPFDASSMATPFGAMKDAGHRRDRSLHALDSYTQLTTWISPA